MHMSEGMLSHVETNIIACSRVNGRTERLVNQHSCFSSGN